MGIRLQCPNGHKVHVKSFLAGKRGICPQCGAKFDIPADPNLSSDDGGGDVISVVPSPGDPAALDLDAIAAAGGTSLLGGQAFGPAGQRLASRRKSTQTMRTFTLVLTVVVTLLACVLLYIVFRAR